MLRGIRSNELYNRIEKLTRMVNKAAKECHQHPNGKTIADYLEMTFSKHANAMQEACTQYQKYKATSTEHNDNIDICDELFKCLFIQGNTKKGQ